MALVKHTNNSLSNITALPSAVPTGKMTLLSTATASSSASLSFDSTYINSDYLVYKFEFINMHPATDVVDFQFNLSTDNGSNYNVTKTTTFFRPYQLEGAEQTGALEYQTGEDLAQSTAYQSIADRQDNDNDSALSGTFTLFNPSSTVFVKHFMSVIDRVFGSSAIQANDFMAGYGNTTSAVNAINFKFSSGNIDAGQIKLYGWEANGTN